MQKIIISNKKEKSKVIYPSGKVEKGDRLDYDLIK